MSTDPSGAAAERRALRGPKGDKGDRGRAVLSARTSKALVALFLLPSLIAVAAAAGVVVQTRGYQSAHARTERTQAQTVRKLDRTVRKLDATVRKLKREVRSQCGFDGYLSPAPVLVSQATGRPSLLGVQIVSGSRVAWHQAGCPGRLAPPSPSFARWARYYHLPTG